MAKFYWDDLLDCLTTGSRSVVPVVGNELLRIPDEHGVPAPFSDQLARRCARFLRERHGLELVDDATLPTQMRAARREEVDFSPALHAAHQEILNEVRRAGSAALPESLRLLADIGAFPFFVSTTADDLCSLTLGLTRPEEILAAQLDRKIDLPVGWQPSQPPRLFQIFGRFGAGGEPAITEADTLEYLAHLQSDKGWADRLLSHLRESHLLFLGNQHPDWLARVFMRFLRGGRFFGHSRPAFEAIADSDARGDSGEPLVSFLKAYSPKTRVFDEDDTAGFIRTLHAKWRERTAPAPPPPAATDADAEDTISGEGNLAPEPMDTAAIFISYASEDRAAAEKFAAALADRKLPFWFDKRRLAGGDNFSSKIKENVRRSRLFIPLISRQTAARQDGWFRHEWQWAREYLERVGPGMTWLIPVVIDDFSVNGSADMQRYFMIPGFEPQVLRCPGGVPDTGQLAEFVQKFRATVRG